LKALIWKIANDKLVSDKRIDYPAHQVVTRESIQEISTLLDKNEDFSIILSNLLFSTNNPF